jgi:hypothetical protein
LFLGAGFSVGAINIAGHPVPSGTELTEVLAHMLNTTPSYGFETLAEELYRRSPDELRTLLYNSFTVKQLAEHQQTIALQPWRRVYTTNYDDCLEFALHHGVAPSVLRSYRG